VGSFIETLRFRDLEGVRETVTNNLCRLLSIGVGNGQTTEQDGPISTAKTGVHISK
jgi:hypothetical protein